ncbi:acyltransferase family protein [Nocardioides sp. WS12]|uniref:acyltransferase family protein n=1 Tax=Nocardioides sp. WS12 TaxID=2486272 RepID=UPI0015FADAA8|nr:acyltransferase family protein [Nocardioides sp. WS12]
MTESRAFRSDIQGLRALAVGLVILAHAGFRTASGGFVGVDVFFVISGFLIVGLLVREAGESRRISIVDFYARRARRVIPAATVVLAVTAFAAAYFLPFVRSIEVIKDAVWAAFFGANIRFSLVETDYFAEGEPPSPVQHYWSLAVEEQFYVVIPVLLLLIAVALRRWGHALPENADRALRRAVVAVLGAVTLGSLAYSVWVTEANPTAAYFSTPARAWELGIGGLLATLLWGRRPALPRWLTELAGVAGLALIAYATLTFSSATPMPGTAALVPVGGSGLLLAAGASTSAPSTYWFRLFSLQPIRVLGDWSYSLYLWHFPVLLIAQAHWQEPRLSRPHLAFALVLIVALSAASYHLIEEPFRRGVRWKPRMRAIGLYPISLALVIGSAFGAHAWVDHQIAGLADNPEISTTDYQGEAFSDDPTVALVQASVLAAEDARPVPGGLKPDLGRLRDSVAPLGDCDYRLETKKLCPFGDTDADRSIVVIGDSHARMWGPALSTIGKAQGYVVYQFVFSACPANAAPRVRKDGGALSDCDAFKEWALEQVADLHPALVVVANNFYRPPAIAGGAAGQDRGLAEEFALLKASSDRVVMLGNVPKVKQSPGECLSRRDVDLSDCLFEPNPGTVRGQHRFRDVAKANGVEFIDVLPWFCADGQCPPVVGRIVPLRDREHLTVEYSEYLAGPLAVALGW